LIVNAAVYCYIDYYRIVFVLFCSEVRLTAGSNW